MFPEMLFADRTSLQAPLYKTVLVLIIHDPKVACFLILTLLRQVFLYNLMSPQNHSLPASTS